MTDRKPQSQDSTANPKRATPRNGRPEPNNVMPARAEDQKDDETAEARALLGAADPGVWGPFTPRPQGFDALRARFYEAPSPDRTLLQLWCYTDRISYEAGDWMQIHASASCDHVAVTIYRDDLQQTAVAHWPALATRFVMPPADFAAQGCAWPVLLRWQLPAALASGFYIIRLDGRSADGREQDYAHGFFIRPSSRHRPAPILLLAASCTWTAYNDWGGACSYGADSRPDGLPFAPRLHLHRPYARGFIRLPANAPRKRHDHRPGPQDLTRYPQFEFAYQRGYSRYYANAGWASFERIFSHWAAREGFDHDIACQHDLHHDPDLLARYACVVIVGHDEYWSREMRLALEQYLAHGGRLARFAGNFAWQVRLEDQGLVQVCYNRLARTHDPVVGTSRAHLATASWEDPLVGWPGAQTIGLNGLWGIYAGFGSLVGAGSGGFTVYRPEHWAFAGTGLGYGDILGGAAQIFGYEVDGLDYVIRDGLPMPTGRDGARPGTEIIAMGLAENRETPRPLPGEQTYLPDETAYFALCRYGEVTPETRAMARRGSGMIVTVPFGRGEIFNAGSIDWVAGLLRRDAATEIVTRRVLHRYSERALDP